MLKKEFVLKALERMPEVFSIEDLEKAILDIKIEIAYKQIQQGEFLTEEQLDAEIRKWQ